ncbi:hypothetical protein C6558_32550 [Ensifer sp. NM-2]|nr:hypothetical protein C6558_32550 [Ensifer sp. NM-2]
MAPRLLKTEVESGDVAEKVTALVRENRELCQATEILRKACDGKLQPWRVQKPGLGRSNAANATGVPWCLKRRRVEILGQRWIRTHSGILGKLITSRMCLPPVVIQGIRMREPRRRVAARTRCQSL